MDLSNWLTILAIILAPLVAIQISRWLSLIGEQKKRRLEIFRTLMTTRGFRISVDHVNALNLIDIDFNRKKDEKIVEKWKLYHDHLNDTSYDSDRIDEWIRKGDDFLINLLYEMSQVLGYKYSEVVIKRGCYIPRKYGDDEIQSMEFRSLVLEILKGDKNLPVTLVGNATDESKDLIEKSMKYYKKLIDGDVILKVKVVEKDDTIGDKGNSV